MVYRQPPIRKNNVKASRGWSQRHRSTKYHRDLLRTRGKAGPKPRFPLFEFFYYAKKRNHKVLVQVLIKFSVDVFLYAGEAHDVVYCLLEIRCVLITLL